MKLTILLLLAMSAQGQVSMADNSNPQPGAHIYSIQELEAQGWKKSEISICLFQIFADGHKELDGPNCPDSVVKEAALDTLDAQLGNGDIVFKNDFLNQPVNDPPRAADETDGKPPSASMTPVPWPHGVGGCPNCEIDVPAVQVIIKAPKQGACPVVPDHTGNDGGGGAGNGGPVTICGLLNPAKTIHTCADKSRILLHDESTPPKYWCHKVQP